MFDHIFLLLLASLILCKSYLTKTFKECVDINPLPPLVVVNVVDTEHWISG